MQSEAAEKVTIKRSLRKRMIILLSLCAILFLADIFRWSLSVDLILIDAATLERGFIILVIVIFLIVQSYKLPRGQGRLLALVGLIALNIHFWMDWPKIIFLLHERNFEKAVRLAQSNPDSASPLECKFAGIKDSYIYENGKIVEFCVSQRMISFDTEELDCQLYMHFDQDRPPIHMNPFMALAPSAFRHIKGNWYFRSGGCWPKRFYED